MRRLDTRPVPMEMIRTIIDAGTRVASGQNTQPWHFVVITETEGKSKLGGWYQEVLLCNVPPDRANKSAGPPGRGVQYGAPRR